MREDPTINKNSLVTNEEGEALAASLKGFAYVECSSKTSEGVTHLLEVIAGASLSLPHDKIISPSRTCKIL